MRAVRAGGDRQEAHEVIRRHSIAAARAMKDDGTRNDMLERLAGDPEFGVPIDDLRRRARSRALRRPRAASRWTSSSPRSSSRCSPGRRRRRATSRRCAYDRRRRRRRCRSRSCAAARCATSTRSTPIACSLVATDRVSAFDVVMREPVPYKGAVLTQLTAWWLRQLEATSPHHMISADVDEIVARGARRSTPHRDAAARPRDALPAHRRVPGRVRDRGYIAGSAWKEYRTRGTLAGEPLPPACARATASTRRSSAPPPRPRRGTTRTSRSRTMARDRRRRRGRASSSADAARLRRAGAPSPSRAGSSSPTRSSSSARATARIMLIDEVLTPDSSRFWPADEYAPGRSQPSFDKQPLRDYLDGERAAGRWNGDAPPPPLPRRRRRGDERALSRRLPSHHRQRRSTSRSSRELRPRRLAVHRHRRADRGGGATPLALDAALVAALAARVRAHAHRALGRVLLPRSRAHRRARRRARHRAGRRQGRDDHRGRRAGVPARPRDARLDLHERLQRAREPVSGVGTVRYVHYNPGKFLNAATEKSSLENEQTSVGIEASGASHPRPADRRPDRAAHLTTAAKASGRAGRAHGHHPLRLARRRVRPAASTVRVKVGETTVAGTTVIAELPAPMKRPRLPTPGRARAPSCCCRTGSRCEPVLRHLRDRARVARATSARRRCSSCSAASPTRSTGASRARRGTGSRFGEELDSLVDAISFGLAPALIMYFAVLNQRGLGLDLRLHLHVVRRDASRALQRRAGRPREDAFPRAAEPGRRDDAGDVLLVQPDAAVQRDVISSPTTTLAELPWHTILRWLMVGLAYFMISDVPYPAVPTIGYKSLRADRRHVDRARQHPRR